MTPKEIAKAIKAKGLQKLRWYCQMCQKQCRDENGFKQHCTSDSHQRMMKVFAENPHSFLDDFSKQFEEGFMDLVRRRWRTKRIEANKVYNEYIQDRAHIHMNATKWVTLTEFVAYLGKSGLVEVEETEKAIFIKYIDRDPEMLKLQEAIKKKEKMDYVDDMRNQKRIEAQLAALQQLQQESGHSDDEEQQGGEPVVGGDGSDAAADVTPRHPDEKIKISLGGLKKMAPALPTVATIKNEVPSEAPDAAERKRKREDEQISKQDSHNHNTAPPDAKRPKLSAIEEIRLQQEAKKERENRKDYWLFEGIIVKILNKKVADGAFYKKKGVVIKVEDTYLAVIKVLDSGHKLKIDQADLETVIPNKGGRVLIVNGAYRGEQGVLVDVLVDQFKAVVRVDSGHYRGNTVDKPYEDICKIASAEEQN